MFWRDHYISMEGYRWIGSFGCKLEKEMEKRWKARRSQRPYEQLRNRREGGVPNKTWRSLYGLYTPQQQHFPVQAKHPYKNTKLHSFSNNI